MTNMQARVMATALIYTALTILGVAAMVTSSGGSSPTWILMVLIGGATMATLAVWHRASGDETAVEEAGKAKRRSRVERMMEHLDDRDLDELRYRLTNDHADERVSLDELELVRTEYRE